VAAAGAATDPHDVVVPGGKWTSGSLIQQIGQNCSIIGGSYTETMVSGIGDYGGAASGGVPKVGERYYTSLLLSVPGNPCGPGSSSIETDVVLPRGTSVDTSAPIRCFGQTRAGAVVELTGGSWSFLGSSGLYCPTSVHPSALHPGAVSVSFRPIASGQLFWVFVPVTSTQVLSGSGSNDRFVWTTDATGVYENPGASSIWSWVFASGTPSGPSVYFTREPHPFWQADGATTPTDTRNRVEFWANVYTGGAGGNLCFTIVKVPSNAPVADCSLIPYNPSTGGGWQQTVAPGSDYISVIGTPPGPTGGYTPFSFDPPGEWGQDMRITWTFDPTGTAGPVSGSQTFHTLPGPDTDADGVADAVDSCPAVAGTLASGCAAPVQSDPDGDGVYGAADQCPAADGQGALSGCPATPGPGPGPVGDPGPGTPPPPPPAGPPTGGSAQPATALKGAFAAGTSATPKRRALLAKAGLPVKVTCTRAAAATLTLAVTSTVAKRLKLPPRTLTLASAKGTCAAGRTLTLTLRPASKVAARLKRAKGTVAATLKLSLKAKDGKPVSAVKAVKLT
jgi:hypothetical protein